MKKALKVLLGLVVVLVVAVCGIYIWASRKATQVMSRTVETHRVSFPIPFPLTAEEMEELAPGQDRDSAALANAVERGRHLVEARYACAECHGRDFSGGVMIDDPAMGRILGPNLTTGPGSRTLAYQAADWDRIVRHGVKPDGSLTPMPSEEFQSMSDEELSDIVAYIRSLPPVDNEVPPVRLGPIGKVLLATGALPLSADLVKSHTAMHPEMPPVAEASAEFGQHLAGACMGCHRENLSGGPIVGGDPSWPPAGNLTPDPDGLAGWTYDDFLRAMNEGVRPDGTPLREPMSLVLPFAQNMTDVELQALWAYISSVPAVPTPE